MAGMIHAATLLAILMLLAPLARNIPLACLAGILVVVAYQMSEIEHFRQLLTAPRSDVAVLVITFLLTVFVDLTVAVQVGVVLSALLFIRRMSDVAQVGIVTHALREQFARDQHDHDELTDPNSLALRKLPEGVEVFEISGPFFFGAAEKFKDTLRYLERTPKALILRMRDVPAIDATGLNVLGELLGRCRQDGTLLVLSDVHAQPIVALQKSHLWEKFGVENITGNLDDALSRVRSMLGCLLYTSPSPRD